MIFIEDQFVAPTVDMSVTTAIINVPSNTIHKINNNAGQTTVLEQCSCKYTIATQL